MSPRLYRRVMAAMLLTLLAGCDDTDPVKIGFVGGLSGRSADIGEASRNALQLAVEETNRAGGIDGRKIELLVRDDADDSAVAAGIVHDLHDAGVTAIIGPNTSSITAAMLPAINELGVVTISPTASALELANHDDYLFRINWTTRDNAVIYANFYASRGVLRVAAAIDAHNKVFTESWLAEFTQAYEDSGGEVLAHDMFDANDARGYSDTAKNLLATDADALLLIANGVDTAQLAQQIRKLDSEILLIAAEWAASERLVHLGGTAIEDLELVQSYDRYDQSEHYLQFRNAYFDQFQQEPGYSSLAAYDAATMLFRALNQQQDDQSLKDTLLSLGDVQGLQQIISFNEYGDAQRQAFFVVVREGEFVAQ